MALEIPPSSVDAPTALPTPDELRAALTAVVDMPGGAELAVELALYLGDIRRAAERALKELP